MDNFSRGYSDPLEYLQKQYGSDMLNFHTVDTRDTKNLIQLFSDHDDIDTVIHYAALCNVGESEKEPGMYFSNNVCGVVSLMDAMKEVGLKKLVFSSTCALYGEPKSETLDENHPMDPTHHSYGESKYMAERVIDWYSKVHGLKYVFLRYFNVCGARDDGEIGDSKKPSFHLMQNAIRGALGIDEFFLNYTEVDTPDGSPIRDYVNVVDLNRAHIAAVEKHDDLAHSDVFNLGTGEGYSVLEIINKVKEITGKDFPMQSGERRKGDVSKAVASNEKITRVLGWTPTHSLQDSVESLVSWYTKHPHGWDK